MKTKNLSKEQQSQENIYSFPYHYLPESGKKGFRTFKSLWWGYEYLAYLEIIIEKIKEVEFSEMIDIGCGDARLIFELKKIFPEKNLIGQDFSERALAFARAFNPDVEFTSEKIEEIAKQGKNYGLVSLIEVLEHIPTEEVENFVKNLAKIIKPKGRLILTVPSKVQKLNKKHYQHFDEATLRAVMERHFKILEIKFLCRKSLLNKFIEALFENRFFVLNNNFLNNKIYNFYKKTMLISPENKAKRLMIVCEKN